MRIWVPACVFLLAAMVGGTAFAQDEKPQEPISFAGGQFTIEQPEQYGEKILSFDGKELARNYFVSFDRIATVDGVEVALFQVGDGGNACGPAALMVWKPDGGDIGSISVGEDECGAPPMAVSDYAIYFVPWLLPGASEPVRQWSPADGMSLSGNLTYMPDPGTGWKDIGASYDYVLDAFRNEAVYKAAQTLLGERLTEMATSLLVGTGTEKTPSGILYGRGCVPHNCGGNDGFMAIDAAHEKLYFARQDEPDNEAWPALDTWPAELRKALDAAFAKPQ